MKKKELYEEFHRVTKHQKKIPNTGNFTHGELIKTINGSVKQKNLNVLDVGCGTGSIDFYLANNGHYVTGIDISTKAIDSCKTNSDYFGLTSKTTFIQTTIESFKPKNKFDLILLIEVIEHVQDDTILLKKLHKLLKNGGVLILTTPSLTAPLFKIGFLKGFDERVGHLRRYDSSSLKKKLHSSGFKVSEIRLTEGIVRNYIFTSTVGSVFLRIINRVHLVNLIAKFLDKLSLCLGYSDIQIVATKK